MTKVYSVPFRIWGRVEIAALSEDDAWDQAQEMTTRDMIDNASTVTVDCEAPEGQD